MPSHPRDTAPLSASSPCLKIIAAHAEEGAALRRHFFAAQASAVHAAGLAMAITLAKGRKVLFCGNGGSAADAQHLAAELVNRFQLDRPPLPALALTTDTSILTAVSNDLNYEQVFARQVLALGQPDDMLVGISTSGASPNVLAALRAAQLRGMRTLGLSGQNGARMAPLCHVLLQVPHASTPLVQEVHIAIGHMLCLLVDHFLFENVAELTRAMQSLPPEE